MKQSKILKIVAIFIIGMLVFCNIVMAENEVVTDNTTVENTTNESTNTTPQEPVKNEENDNTEEKTPVVNNNSSSQTSKPVQTTAKSDNADLTNLGIRPNDFSGFTPNKLTYDVTVPLDVESIEVYATASDSKASISGTGKKNLKEGLNEFEIVVTAEDGTVKTYTINVTREESATEETGTEESIGEGLASLKIADLELTPEFETNVYEYKVKYIGDATSLDIQTETTNPEFIAEVVGNQELVEGENIITILVSDADGNNIATYQITVEKSLVDYEVLAREKAEKQRNMIIGGVVVAALVIGIIVFVVIRRKRNKNIAREFSIPYSNLNNDNDDFMANEDEMSKVLVRAGSRKSEEETAGKVESNTPNAKLADEETKKMDIQKIREEYLNNFNNQENKEPTKSSRVIRRKGKRYM